MFQEERPFLKPLPLEGCRYFDQQKRTVWDDGCIQVHQAYYSALPAPLYREVWVRLYDSEIEILDPKTLVVIRRHAPQERRGAVVMEASDRIFHPSRQTAAILELAARLGPRPHALCEHEFRVDGRTGQRRMRGVVALSRQLPAALLEQAAQIILVGDGRSCKAVRAVVQRLAERASGPPLRPSALTQEHELIRSGKEYGLFWPHHAQQAPSTEPHP